MSKFRKPIGTPVPGVERAEEIRDRREKRKRDEEFRNNDRRDETKDGKIRDVIIPKDSEKPNPNEIEVIYRKRKT